MKSYFVANGSFFDGVKTSVVVPAQRNLPATSGATWNHGTATTFGILPSGTIGSLKMTRISFASESCASSPTGPALMMVSLSVAACAREARKRTARTTHFFMGDILAPENDSRCRLRHLTGRGDDIES